MKIAFIVLAWAAGAAFGLSAHRPVGVDYRALAEKHRESYPFDIYQSAYDAASDDFTHLDPAKVPQENDIQKLFLLVRDHRELDDQEHSVARRIPWLYPYEGCWIRATIANLWAVKEKFTRPAKLFMFGNLEAETPNSTSGKVTWWYHVAPIIKDAAGNIRVIDPAINPQKLLTVEEELDAISVNVKSVRVTVCSSFTYEPFDNCNADSAGNSEASALGEVGEYLSLEWSNLLDLGRRPEKELGDEPPWG